MATITLDMLTDEVAEQAAHAAYASFAASEFAFDPPPGPHAASEWFDGLECDIAEGYGWDDTPFKDAWRAVARGVLLAYLAHGGNE